MSANTAVLYGDEDAALLPCTCGPHGSCPRNCRNRKRRSNPEALIQRAIIDRLRFCGIMAVAVPNEGKRTTATGRVMKHNGLRPGFPDLICMQAGRVAFLEVKSRSGVVSGTQAACHAELERQGMRVAVVRSQEEAIASLKAWGFRV